VSAVFISNEKENGLRRHSMDVDAGMKRHSMVNKVHTTLEIDVEAAESNLVGTRRGSFESISKKKSKNGIISGKLVIVITDSGVGLSRINLKRLFKEVNSSNLYEHNFYSWLSYAHFVSSFTHYILICISLLI
jgi:hypothetical protein